MRQIFDLEKRISGLENRKPFRLRIFIRITLNPGHDVFDRAEARGEYFVREEGESDQEFRDRIMSSTDANPITMYPQSYDDKFRAIRESNAAQIQTLNENASKFESGRETPDPALTPRADRDRRLEALSRTRRG